MTNPAQPFTLILSSIRRGLPFALALVCALTMVAAQSAVAQTFTVLHNFTGGGDGANPYAGLTMDRGGNLYGTAYVGGLNNCVGGGCGTVFKLSRTGTGWVFNPLYSFSGVAGGGANPLARVVFGPDGALYGTTSGGGLNSPNGYGTVFRLMPPATACKSVLCYWTETTLYSFEGSPNDGADPSYGDVIFDPAGNLYGTTTVGGSGQCSFTTGCGTAYELAHSSGGWTESVIYSFGNGPAALPYSGMILDSSSNLYGTTATGTGLGDYGVVYELIPASGGWSLSVLLDADDGSALNPTGGLIFDQSGNLYGTFSDGGSGQGGGAFELVSSGGGWMYRNVSDFTCNRTCRDVPGPGPQSTLTMDASGTLYGTTYGDGAYGYGSVFKLTHSGNGWTYTSLHDFTDSDGGYPYGQVILDASGNLYGTASSGGNHGNGVVWEITP